MNKSELITRIKLDLGLISIATPFEDINSVISEILDSITTPVFSIYQPVKEDQIFDLNDLRRLDKTTDMEKYLLPDFGDRTLLYVFDLNYDTSVLGGLGYYGGGMPLMQGNLISQTMLSNAGASLMNTLIPKITFEFEPPKTIKIYNAYSASKVVFSFGFEHDKTLASIPETARESYLTLGKLDVKENLYSIMKNYTELNTAIGNIDLKLDTWQSAADERKSLIEGWDNSYHIDMKPVYYI